MSPQQVHVLPLSNDHNDMFKNIVTLPEPLQQESVETEIVQQEPVETEIVQQEPVETEPVQQEQIEPETEQQEQSEPEIIQQEPVETEIVQQEQSEPEIVQQEQSEQILPEPIQPIQFENTKTNDVIKYYKKPATPKVVNKKSIRKQKK
jgi:hypothetical protein